MYQYLVGLRAYMRSTGILRSVSRVVNFRDEWNRRRYFLEYQEAKHETVKVKIGGVVARFKVLSGSHYASLREANDRKFVNFVLNHLSHGGVFWDVGANVGYYTMFAAEKVGIDGSVCAFEPLSEACAILKDNMELNNIDNVQVIHSALSNHSGTGWFKPLEEAESGAHKLVETQGHEVCEEAAYIPVDLLIGDVWRNQTNGRVPNAVKVDVEGAELDVLVGMRNTLAEPECRAVLVELHFANLAEQGQNNAPSEILDLLKTVGFTNTKWLDWSHVVGTKLCWCVGHVLDAKLSN